jgi:hypothetical protein
VKLHPLPGCKLLVGSIYLTLHPGVNDILNAKVMRGAHQKPRFVVRPHRFSSGKYRYILGEVNVYTEAVVARGPYFIRRTSLYDNCDYRLHQVESSITPQPGTVSLAYWHGRAWYHIDHAPCLKGQHYVIARPLDGLPSSQQQNLSGVQQSSTRLHTAGKLHPLGFY